MTPWPHSGMSDSKVRLNPLSAEAFHQLGAYCPKAIPKTIHSYHGKVVAESCRCLLSILAEEPATAGSRFLLRPYPT